MLAKLRIVQNYKEVERGKELGMDTQEKIAYVDFGFKLDDVITFYYIPEDSEITLIFRDTSYIVKYTSSLLEILKSKFNNS